MPIVSQDWGWIRASTTSIVYTEAVTVALGNRDISAEIALSYVGAQPAGPGHEHASVSINEIVDRAGRRSPIEPVAGGAGATSITFVLNVGIGSGGKMNAEARWIVNFWT